MVPKAIGHIIRTYHYFISVLWSWHMLEFVRLHWKSLQNILYIGCVCLRNLRPLCHSSQLVDDSLLIKMALVKARSLCSKTFILRDYFTSKSLDVLFVTEMWLCSGDLSPFPDWLPWTVNLFTLRVFWEGVEV